MPEFFALTFALFRAGAAVVLRQKDRLSTSSVPVHTPYAATEPLPPL